jgi:predicted phage terminase large subunit-like protein
VVEPGNPLIDGWVLHAICDHLQAVSEGKITRLLINVPPGMSKSTLLNVMWPAYEWGPLGFTHYRYICAAHSQTLSIRDSTRMRRLVESEWYKARWPSVILTSDQNAKTKFENTDTGFREALAASGITGARADRVLVDDPLSVTDAQSEQILTTIEEWFLEAVPLRLVNPLWSAIVVIMQRLSERDTSGVILEKQLGYEHLMLPMEYDSTRPCSTSIGFTDPRTEDGELLFPQRFPQSVVDRDKRVMGPYAVAGQFQQIPSPRGGGILRGEWWNAWTDAVARDNNAIDSSKFPRLDLIVASLDTAMSAKQESDYSALVTLGLWHNHEGIPQLIVMDAWQKRLNLHGSDLDMLEGETLKEWRLRTSDRWGLYNWVKYSCKRFPVDTLLIESSAAGLPLEQELRRLSRQQDYMINLVKPTADKVARAYAIQGPLADGQIWAPDRAWADALINQCGSFPKGAHDDLVDAFTQGVAFFRNNGLLARKEDLAADFAAAALHKGRAERRPLYDV